MGDILIMVQDMYRISIVKEDLVKFIKMKDLGDAR